jgi:MFS family permease
MYQAEVSTPESRGFMVSMHGIMFAMGYSLSAWIGFGCYFANASSSFAWRFPLAFQTVPALMLLAASPWLPFSPRWLLQQDRPEDAHDVLKKLHHNPRDSHERAAIAAKEFYQMKKQLEMDRQMKAHVSSFEIFRTAPNRRRAYVGFTLMFGNQFTGVLYVDSCLLMPREYR